MSQRALGRASGLRENILTSISFTKTGLGKYTSPPLISTSCCRIERGLSRGVGGLISEGGNVSEYFENENKLADDKWRAHLFHVKSYVGGKLVYY